MKEKRLHTLAYRRGALTLLGFASASLLVLPALRMDVSTSLQYHSLSRRRWWNLALAASWCGCMSERAIRSLSGHLVRV